MPRGEYIQKPSYGLVGFSRITGTGTPLFGSELRHHTMIALRVHTARVERKLSRDFIYEDKPVVEVWLSEMQFAELLTTMNIGSGVPGTITFRDGVGHIEHEAEGPKRAQFDSEVAADCKRIANRLAKLEQAVANPKIPAGVRKELEELARATRQDIESNLPFVQKQFREAMNRTETEAKAAVEGFMVHVITRAGLEALGAKGLLPEMGERGGETPLLEGETNIG
jgi:hypothetical protein